MLLVKKNTQCCGNRNRKRILGESFSFIPGNKGWTEIKKYDKICIRNDQVKDELIADANRPQVGDDLQSIFTQVG